MFIKISTSCPSLSDIVWKNKSILVAIATNGMLYICGYCHVSSLFSFRILFLKFLAACSVCRVCLEASASPFDLSWLWTNLFNNSSTTQRKKFLRELFYFWLLTTLPCVSKWIAVSILVWGVIPPILKIQTLLKKSNFLCLLRACYTKEQ